jgi:hypothetical protein
MTDVQGTRASDEPVADAPSAGGRCPVFDPHSPDLAPDRAYELYAELRTELRTTSPVSRGEQHGGYWA